MGWRLWSPVTAMLAVASVLIGLAGTGWHTGTASLPVIDGRLGVAGLSAPVDIVRDAFGIPTIRAAGERDAMVGLGYVHAQDRLWQMEAMRRAATGRLSELIGESGLATDRVMRVFGLGGLVEESWRHLAPEVRDALTAYADGVNAWLATRPGPLPPEFIVLGHTPEPWRPQDSLLWLRLMALRLGGDWREDLVRLRVAAVVPPERRAELWPEEPADLSHVTLGAPPAGGVSPSPSPQPEPRTQPEPEPEPVSPEETGAVDALAGAVMAALPDWIAPAGASNAWVVAGTRTVSGKPLLANDPHLGFNAPILWYLARIETPGLTVAGATLPGLPFHLLGHNGRVAWGLTATHADTQDVFVEQAVGDTHYATPQGPRPFDTRVETIQVRFAEPVRLTVRATRHGPVISDGVGLVPAGDGQGGVLALASTALLPDDRTAESLYRLARASSWAEFRAALATVSAPVQNVTFAAVDGTIAFAVPGRVPVRAGGDGTLPAAGADGAADWVGWVPVGAMPDGVNPPGGQFVNANNRVVPADHPVHIAASWPESWRARRADALLGERTGLDDAAMQAIQLDTVSPPAVDLVPRLLHEVRTAPAAGVTWAAGRREALALGLLDVWDGRADRDGPEALLFWTWMVEVKRALFADELKGAYGDWRGLRVAAIRQALTVNRHWCDDVATGEVEGCGARLSLALSRAVAILADRHGEDPGTWRWGDAHRAVFAHDLFDVIPGLRQMASRSIETDGDDHTLNQGGSDSSRPPSFPHVHGPGLRAIYDLADLNRSRFIIATGQSGHPLSAHYDDLLPLWRDGLMLTMAGVGTHRLRLDPQRRRPVSAPASAPVSAPATPD